MKNTHFMSMVKIGPKGQIVVPKEIRDMFGLEPGDNLIILADVDRGIALQKEEKMRQFLDSIFDGGEDPAVVLKRAAEDGSDEK